MAQGTVNNFWPGGRGSEDFGCVTIKATRPQIRLRSILMNPPLNPHWQPICYSSPLSTL